MAAINSVATPRLPLPTFSPHAVLMYSAAVGGEGAVALQLREAKPGELDSRLHEDRLAITCHEPELLADLLHAAADIDGDHDGLSALLGSASPDLALASDASDSLPLPDHDNEDHTDQIIFLKNNNEPWSQVIDCWNKTFEVRECNTYDNISDFIEEWNILNDPRSDSLINLDFDQLYPERSTAFFKNWKWFINKIISLKFGESKDDTLIYLNERIQEQPDDDCTRSSSGGVIRGITTVSVAVRGIEARPSLTTKRVRPKPSSPNRQGPQQCQVCNKIFGNASALAKHKLTHSDERKYVCVTCAKAFKRQDHLNGHMLTHRNKKPYECKADGCGKSYCDARSLRRHTENHHLGKGENGSPGNGTSRSGHSSGSERVNSPRLSSPSTPRRNQPPHSESSNSSSERRSASVSGSGGSSGSGSDCSPPRSPPGPPTPPAKPAKSKSSSKPKSSASTTQQGSQKNGSGANGSGSSSASTSAAAVAASARGVDVKQVECNLCHRKFKNIPALNGHMRLHGGYFKKDADNKKLDKKESTGPPLQTASVSVRALIEEKIISRRVATASSSATVVRTGFAAPAPPPLSSIRSSAASTAPTSAASLFVSPRAPPAPPVVTVTTNVSTNITAAQRDSTLIELLKKGNSKGVVKRSASDPGNSPQQDFSFRPELFGVSFNSDDGYFSPALNEDTFQFTTTSEQLDELALEDYANVAASIGERSPVNFPSNRRLAAVLNSPLPESLADFGACHGGSPVPSPGIGFTANSPGLSYTAGDSPGLGYAAASPSGGYSSQPEPSPGLAFPTPPASHDAHSPAHTIPRASSPLSAAFFTAAMSSQEEVEEALEEVLPECRSLDAYALDPTARRIMLNSEDPLLSSSPRDFSNQRSTRRQNRSGSSSMRSQLQQWQNDALQVCVEGRDNVPAVFLSPNSVPASPRRKRRASPAGPFRSRMRRTSHHYTPQPILPPDRDGSGLFIELTAGLAATETDILAQLEEPSQPRINIGRDYQADLPEFCANRIDLHRAPEQLLWDPGINDILDDNEVRMFMELAMCAAMPVGGHTREFALQTLGECGGDIRAATFKLMSRPTTPSHFESRWTPDEVEAFLAGLTHYDKDFYKIAKLVRTKDSKQCVQFYYFWKKVTKDYKTLYLRSWSLEQQSQGSVGQTTQVSAVGVSSPSSYESEEFPCKICGKVFNKVKSRSAHMKSHRPLDAEPKRPKLEKPYEKVERSDDRAHATAEYRLPSAQ